MSLEEKFEALMKSCQTVISINNELKHNNEEMMSQNAYLRKQLDKSMKQKQRAIESPTGSRLEDLSEAESQHSIYEEEPRTSARARRPIINIDSNDFRVDIP